MESNTTNSPEISLHKRQGKSTHFQTQIKMIFAAQNYMNLQILLSHETKPCI